VRQRGRLRAFAQRSDSVLRAQPLQLGGQLHWSAESSRLCHLHAGETFARFRSPQLCSRIGQATTAYLLHCIVSTTFLLVYDGVHSAERAPQIALIVIAVHAGAARAVGPAVIAPARRRLCCSSCRARWRSTLTSCARRRR
jgi:hypothetical protein